MYNKQSKIRLKFGKNYYLIYSIKNMLISININVSNFVIFAVQKHVDNEYKSIYNCMCYVYFEGKVIIFINGKKI